MRHISNAPAEEKFKQIVRDLVALEIYPSPAAIMRQYNHQQVNNHNLNGRQVRWRAQVLQELGWKYLANPSKLKQWVPSDSPIQPKSIDPITLEES